MGGKKFLEQFVYWGFKQRQYILFKLRNLETMASTVKQALCFLIVFCSLGCSLHISKHEASNAEQAQLDYLIGLQKNYKTQIVSLNQKIKLVKEDLDKAEDLDEQVKILEAAIVEEREQIGTLSYKIIPDPNAVELECQVLSKEDQQALTEKAEALESQIKQLEDLVLSVPYCDEIEAIRQEIQKMKANVELVKRTAKNNCQQHFIQEEAIYQTNLYNTSNWILGKYTMDDLINEYYDRNMQYGNISNCPLETPYYASQFPREGLGRCIACKNSDPIFDIQKKKCTSCPFDFELNQTSHACQQIPKNSNYTYGKNYMLAPLKLIPLPNPDLSSCPQDRPFFDGQVCVACQLPSNYWQISEKVCKACENGTAFNINMRKCMIKEQDKLTVLFGTKWVTEDGNIKKVLDERVQVLQENKTSGKYQYCPDLTPFYDDIACIYCPEDTVFNLDTNLCTKAPEGLKYNSNMRQFIKPQTNFETDPKAENYISKEPLKDNALIPNCNKTHPYYDSIACVKCQNPFIVFDVDTLRCSLCDPIEIYNATTHKCDLRKYIYLKGSEERLMATENVSIEDYQQSLKDAVTKYPDALPLQCQDQTFYAGIEQCYECSLENKEYFNVEDLECQICDGTVDAETRICHERTYYLPNVDANKMLFSDSLTLEQAKQQIKNKLAEDNQNKVCPLANPIPINDLNDCSICNETQPLYNYTSKTCVACKEGEKYDQKVYKCKKIKYLTDLTADVLIEPPLTKQSLIQNETQLNKTEITERCPPEKPYTYDHSYCFQCQAPSPIFNASTGICSSCKSPLVFDKQKHICKKVYYLTDLTAEGILQQENVIIPNVQVEQDRVKNNPSLSYEECPPEKPYGSLTGCIQCLQNETYFNLKTLQCERCPQKTAYWPDTHSCMEITTFSNLEANNTLYVQDEENSLNALKEQIFEASSQGPVEYCPDQSPYYGVEPDNMIRHCLDCPPATPYFILAEESCGECGNYKPENQSCPPKPFRYPNLTDFEWITTSGNADKVVNDALAQREVQGATECPQFYNSETRDCIECYLGTYYNFETGVCETCPDGTTFDINTHVCALASEQGKFYTNIEQSNSEYLLYGGLTIGELEGTQAAMKQQYPDSQYCPESTPYYDGIQCIMCPQYKIYFNLRYNLCQVCLFDETLDQEGHNCLDANRVPVWRKPEGKLVYPYLFGR